MMIGYYKKNVREMAYDNSGFLSGIYPQRQRSRKTLTLTQRRWLWDNSRSQGLSRTCHICGRRITTFDDMELDHIRAASKGGRKLAMTHKNVTE